MHGNLDKTEIMTRFLRYFVLLLTLVFTVDSVAQGADQIRSTHKVKRKETIFGIARMYDLSIEDLIKANPEMKEPGYELKKGAVLNIPYTKPDPRRQPMRKSQLLLLLRVRHLSMMCASGKSVSG